MKLLRRIVTEGRVIRVYKHGGILLSEAGGSLERVSEGAIREADPDAGAVRKCLLCDEPSVHWGMFMTGEQAVAYVEERREEAKGTFFGLCEGHNPHENEDEVCDEVYKIMETALNMENDLEIAETVVNAWLDELTQHGYSRKDALGIVLLKLKDNTLIEGYKFSSEIKEALEIALKDELRKGYH
jgi:hypothetical protein